MREEWRDIPGYKGYYQASNMGRIRRVKKYRATWKGRILKPGEHRDGYHKVTLSKKNQRKSFVVHRLVGEAFLGPLPDGLVTNHKNGDKTDNRVENLEYVTQKQNDVHSRKKLGNHHVGEKNGLSKLTKENVIEIRRMRKTIDEKGRPARYLEIAEKFGISRSHATKIATGEAWSWLDDVEPPAKRGVHYGQSRLSADDVRKIRQLAQDGLSHAEIASIFSVKRRQITRIVNRKRWAWLD